MNVKRTFFAHPLMVLHYLKPFLFVLLIPLFRAVVDAVFNRQINGLLFNEAVICVVTIVYSVKKWKNLKIEITSSSIKVISGVLFKRTADIPISKLSTVQSVRYIGDRIFGAVTLRINTESGRKGKPDFEVKLYSSDIKNISDIFGIGKTKTIKFSAIRLALMAAASSSAFTGLVFIVPVIKQSGLLLGTAIEQILLDRINEANAVVGGFIPPVINTVTVVFLFLYLVAFLISFLKYINFKLSVSDKTLEVNTGIITRVNTAFKIKSVNSAIIERKPLMRFFGRYVVRVSIGGYGDNKGYKPVIIPSAKENEVKGLFSDIFPRAEIRNALINPQKKSQKRFYITPIILFTVSLVSYFIFANLFPIFEDILLFSLLVIMTILIYYLNLAKYNAKKSAISVATILYARYTRWSATREMFCEADRVGLIKIIKWPIDRGFNTCNIRITERSESAESITVKHIDYDEINKRLKKLYKYEN